MKAKNLLNIAVLVLAVLALLILAAPSPALAQANEPPPPVQYQYISVPLDVNSIVVQVDLVNYQIPRPSGCFKLIPGQRWGWGTVQRLGAVCEYADIRTGIKRTAVSNQNLDIESTLIYNGGLKYTTHGYTDGCYKFVSYVIGPRPENIYFHAYLWSWDPCEEFLRRPKP